MSATRRVHWGRVLLAGFLAELSGFVVFFLLLFLAWLAGVPELATPMSTLDYIDALVASFASIFVFTLWVSKRIESGFVLHGALIGAVAMLLFLAVLMVGNGSMEQPVLYWVAHGLKILGGITGGMVAERRRQRGDGHRLESSVLQA